MLCLRYLGFAGLAASFACGEVDPDKEVETSDVTGSWIDVWVTEGGDIELPRDLREGVSVVVANGAGTKTFRGTGSEDGTFVVPSVPEGPFLLRISLHDGFVYYYTEERHVALGRHERGRPDVVRWESATLSADVEGLDPWTSNDRLMAYSYSADGITLALGGSSIAPGATQAEGLPVSWFGGGLPDARQGDVVDWIQSRSEDGPLGLRVRTMVAHGVSSDISLAPDESRDVEVSLNAVADNAFDAWDIRASEFASLTEASPLIEVGEPELNVVATPDARFASTSSGGIVLSAGGPPIGDSDIQFEAAYGDPYPDAWGRVVNFSLELLPKLPLDELGSSQPSMWHSTSLPIELARSAPIRPGLGPARNLRINEESCAEPITVGAKGAVLAWDPPELGTPALYLVQPYRLRDDNFSFEAPMLTSLNELPLFLVSPDATYVFVVQARASPELSTAAPNEMPLPLETVTTITNLVTFSEAAPPP